ncbi:hypothetical protein EDD22DRAFT_850211 [Suillus occidentalis]|nr:hypothetical protein EDD22DRAFT_850211 [Suillus occidentalis]
MMILGPEITKYSRPMDCEADDSWATVTLNFNLMSSGTQLVEIFMIQNTDVNYVMLVHASAITLHATFHASSEEYFTAGQSYVIAGRYQQCSTTLASRLQSRLYAKHYTAGNGDEELLYISSAQHNILWRQNELLQVVTDTLGNQVGSITTYVARLYAVTETAASMRCSIHHRKYPKLKPFITYIYLYRGGLPSQARESVQLT